MSETKPTPHPQTGTSDSPAIANGDPSQAKDMVSSDKEAAVKHEQEDKYPPLPKVLLIMSSLYLANFLVALVRARHWPFSPSTIRKASR